MGVVIVGISIFYYHISKNPEICRGQIRAAAFTKAAFASLAIFGYSTGHVTLMGVIAASMDYVFAALFLQDLKRTSKRSKQTQ